MYLSVGEISKILGISTETIRHYVQEGIITPHKNTANNNGGIITVSYTHLAVYKRKDGCEGGN